MVRVPIFGIRVGGGGGHEKRLVASPMDEVA